MARSSLPVFLGAILAFGAAAMATAGAVPGGRNPLDIQPPAEPARETAGKTVRGPDGTSYLSVPEGWASRKTAGGLQIVAPGGTPSLTITSMPAGQKTLDALIKETVGIYKQVVPGWKETSRTDWKIEGMREAVRLDSTQSIGGQTIQTETYFVRAGDRLYTMVVQCPQAQYEEQKNTLTGIVESWTVGLGGEGEVARPPEEPPPPPERPAETKKVQDRQGIVSFQVPKDWTVEQGDGSLEVSNAAETASVAVFFAPKQVATIEQLVNAGMQQLRQQIQGLTLGGRQKTRVAGQQAERVSVSGQAEGQPLEGELYFLLAEGRQFMVIMGTSGVPFQPQAERLRSMVGTIKIAAAKAPPEPPREKMKTVRAPSGAYSVSLPADWRHQLQGDNLAASGPQMQAHMRCFAGPKRFQTLRQLTDAILQAERQNVAAWTQQSQRQLRLAGLPATETIVAVTAQGQRVHARYYCVDGEDRQFAIVFSCNAAQAAQRQPLFQRILQSWTPAGARPKAAPENPLERGAPLLPNP